MHYKIVMMIILIYTAFAGCVSKQNLNKSPGVDMTSNGENSITGAINVMGYGYEVRVFINGVDIGIKGGMSESKRLFGKNHPIAEKLSADQNNPVCLLKGRNEIKVVFKKTNDNTTGLTVELKTPEQYNNADYLFFYRNNEETELTFTEQFVY